MLERALLLRFEFSENLDEWINTSNARLDGAAPYERLLDGDGMAVLRALLVVPLNPACADSHAEGPHDVLLEEDAAPMRLVG